MNIEGFIKEKVIDIKGFDEEELHLIRNKILNNIKFLGSRRGVYLSDNVETVIPTNSSKYISDFIDKTMSWDETIEGHTFWCLIFNRFRESEGNKHRYTFSDSEIIREEQNPNQIY